MSRGYCQGCGGRVEIDVPPDGHTRAEHDYNCNGECRNCPIAVLCGPVELDLEELEIEKALETVNP